MTKPRKASVNRNTRETQISVRLNIDGKGQCGINTGIGILDHMLELFAFHGLFDLDISAKGDLKVDIHHTNEDIGIVLGEAFKQALKDKRRIKRFGSASVPMEEVLANVAVDISGRGFFELNAESNKRTNRTVSRESQGYNEKDAEHFFDALAKHLGMNLNIEVGPYNPDLHTTLEPIFKALGLSLCQATRIEPRRVGVPSTKGIID